MPEFYDKNTDIIRSGLTSGLTSPLMNGLFYKLLLKMRAKYYITDYGIALSLYDCNTTHMTQS